MNQDTEQQQLLNDINIPDDLRKLEINQLPELCKELRQDIIKEVSCNPGHFAASLGIRPYRVGCGPSSIWT